MAIQNQVKMVYLSLLGNFYNYILVFSKHCDGVIEMNVSMCKVTDLILWVAIEKLSLRLVSGLCCKLYITNHPTNLVFTPVVPFSIPQHVKKLIPIVCWIWVLENEKSRYFVYLISLVWIVYNCNLFLRSNEKLVEESNSKKSKKKKKQKHSKDQQREDNFHSNKNIEFDGNKQDRPSSIDRYIFLIYQLIEHFPFLKLFFNCLF